jgi:hypothetical protein
MNILEGRIASIFSVKESQDGEETHLYRRMANENGKKRREVKETGKVAERP